MAAISNIEGFTAPGFEPVRDAFAANFQRDDDLRELGASLCAYKNGACVVDLWGGFADVAKKRPWKKDTLATVWSSTKGITALAVAMLVDRGQITYQQRVSDVWPEFAAKGKKDITIAQVMSHRAGLPGFEAPTTTDDLNDWNGCAGKLAGQAPVFEPGSGSCYHTITYGNLAGEIVRRVTGKSLGAFIKENMADPLNAEFYLGLPANMDAQVAEMLPPKNLPAGNQFDEAPLPVKMAMTNPALDATVTGRRTWRAAEMPAINGQANGRGLARLYSAVANGEMNGVRLMSSATIAAMSTVAGKGVDMLVGIDPQWCMGVSRNHNGMYGSNPRTIGHSGWGGSFGCADVDGKIAVGYVCNLMGPGLQDDARTRAIMKHF